jgi:predicted Zn-dependent protease
MVLIPESQETALGLESYQEILKTAKISTDPVATATVRRVGARLAAVSDRPDLKWEYTLIDDPKTQNAFCLPGGKVAVYTGILTITQTETGLAVVLGHEIAHAIAKHGAERMSNSLLLSLGAASLEVALRNKPAATRDLFGAAYGVGTGVGLALPFGRLQESEADHIGLIYMAKAGYDPREATAFWRRMESSATGARPPQFLSTHPGHDTRVRQLTQWMPEATAVYEAGRSHHR